MHTHFICFSWIQLQTWICDAVSSRHCLFVPACDLHCTDGCTSEGAGKCKSTCGTGYWYYSTSKKCLCVYFSLIPFSYIPNKECIATETVIWYYCHHVRISGFTASLIVECIRVYHSLKSSSNNLDIKQYQIWTVFKDCFTRIQSKCYEHYIPVESLFAVKNNIAWTHCVTNTYVGVFRDRYLHLETDSYSSLWYQHLEPDSYSSLW